MTERFRVELFLTLLKTAAASQFVLIRRKKNLDTLAMLGIGLAEAKERVLGLVPEDYVSGPNPDDKRLGDEVWVFGLSVERQEIYVKRSASSRSRCYVPAYRSTSQSGHCRTLCNRQATRGIS